MTRSDSSHMRITAVVVSYKLLMRLLVTGLFLAIASTALASTTWYVNGISGSDKNNCTSPTTACKTIGHAISLASSGDSVKVAAAIYTENLTIGFNLRVIGSGASTTIIDGGFIGVVVYIPSTSTHVVLSKLTIRNGHGVDGGGISNLGTLKINACTISDNSSGNLNEEAFGGGIFNDGTLTVNNSTFSFNGVRGGVGGGISNWGRATINNSTISGNTAAGDGGGIDNEGNLTINSSTISGNGNTYTRAGGGVLSSGFTTLQNSIVANNTAAEGGNCWGTITSNGYNLSSDGSCSFNGPGDLNNIDPQLGPLQNNGGPTQTMALPSGSPAVDAGNPNGCRDSLGHLLKRDQRGMPRPDKEDTAGCDMGAYERQSD